jgi:hypothetical protein
MMPDSVWALAQRCWMKNPIDRPDASVVSSMIGLVLLEHPEAARSPVPLPTSQITVEDSMRRTQADVRGYPPFSLPQFSAPSTSVCYTSSISSDVSRAADESCPGMPSLSSAGFDSGYGTYVTEPLITPVDDLGSSDGPQHCHHSFSLGTVGRQSLDRLAIVPGEHPRKSLTPDCFERSTRMSRGYSLMATENEDSCPTVPALLEDGTSCDTDAMFCFDPEAWNDPGQRVVAEHSTFAMNTSQMRMPIPAVESRLFTTRDPSQAGVQIPPRGRQRRRSGRSHISEDTPIVGLATFQEPASGSSTSNPMGCSAPFLGSKSKLGNKTTIAFAQVSRLLAFSSSHIDHDIYPRLTLAVVHGTVGGLHNSGPPFP